MSTQTQQLVVGYEPVAWLVYAPTTEPNAEATRVIGYVRWNMRGSGYLWKLLGKEQRWQRAINRDFAIQAVVDCWELK